MTIPCGLTARIPPAYVATVDDTPIEAHGIRSDVPVEATPADVIAGRDPVLDAAVQRLTGAAK